MPHRPGFHYVDFAARGVRVEAVLEQPTDSSSLRICEALRVLLDSGASKYRVGQVWLRSAGYEPRCEEIAISEWLRKVVGDLSGG
jgi:hypothetical protein